MDNNYSSEDYSIGSPLEGVKTTAAHEFHHVVQNGYNSWTDSWYKEASSVWVESEVYPELDDNVDRLRWGWFNETEISLDYENGEHEYGSWIFNRYLAKRFGKDIVKKIWERMKYDSIFDLILGNEDPITAIQNVLKEEKTNLKDVFIRFTQKTFNNAWYEQDYDIAGEPIKNAPYKADFPWPDIYISKPYSHIITDSEPVVTEKTTNIDHLASRYMEFNANQTKTGVLRVKVDCPDGRDVGARLVYVDFQDNVLDEDKISLGKGNRGKKDIKNFGINGIAKVVLILSNAEPSGSGLDFKYSANMALYEVTVSPKIAALSVEDSQTVTHTISIKNLMSEEEDFDIAWEVKDPSRSISLKSGPDPAQLTIPGGATRTSTFVVQAGGKLAPGDVFSIDVIVTMRGVTNRQWVYDNNLIKQINDHPDETYEVADPSYPGKFIHSDDADTAILLNGFSGAMAHLLGKFGEPVDFVKDDLITPGEDGRPIDDFKTLIIPSGGLLGLDSSAALKSKLDEYVNGGGTLIVMAQQHGYEYSPVPGEISAYGWTEDQSCQGASVAIDSYHQIFAGQDSAICDVGVDGFFAKWPNDATVLLRRTKNNMPAMITYPYGEGRVIATSIYADWAYILNQSTSDGECMVRDMVAWAKKSHDVPEYAPGTPFETTITVENMSETSTAIAKISIIDPSKTVVFETSASVELEPGQDTTFTLNYVAPTKLGFYTIKYGLLNAGDAEVQESQEIAQFAVSKKFSLTPIQPISFAVNSDAEEYANGSDGAFTFSFWNSSGTDRDITVWWAFPHNNCVARSPIYGAITTNKPAYESSLKRTVTVPANGFTSFTYSVPLYSYDRLWADFCDENNMKIGSASRGFYTYDPSVTVKASTDKSVYVPGDNVNVSLELTNKQKNACTPQINVTVLDPSNNKMAESSLETTLTALEIRKENISFELPEEISHGTYVVRTEALLNGKLIGSDTTSFVVPDVRIKVDPVIPPVLKHGANNISFDLKKTVAASKLSGMLTANLKAPNGDDVWSGEVEYDLTSTDTTSCSFSIPIEGLSFGTYKLQYEVTYYGNRKELGEKNIACSANSNLVFGKSLYRARETMEMTATISNTGRFMEELTATVSIPDIGYEKTNILTLSSGQKENLPFIIAIPATIGAGKHNVEVALTLDETRQAQTFSFDVPSSKLKLGLNDTEYSAGDSVNVSIENIGGVDTVSDYEISLIDRNGTKIVNVNNSISLQTFSPDSITFSVPDSAASGEYDLEVTAKDSATNAIEKLSESVTVSGLTANLVVNTDKTIYRTTDTNKDAFGHIQVSQGEINNGTLNLRAVSMVDSGKTWTMQEDWASGVSHNMDLTSQPGSVTIDNTSTPVIEPDPGDPNENNLHWIRVKHDTDAKVAWNSIEWDVDMPYHTNIEFYTRTSDTEAGLINAPWVPVYVDSGPPVATAMSLGYTAAGLKTAALYGAEGKIMSAPGRFIEIKAIFLSDDPENYLPVLYGLSIIYSGDKTLWETTLPVSTDSSLDLSAAFDELTEPGQYTLKGTLYSDLSQVLSTSKQNFNIDDGNVIMTFTTNKDVYKPDEAITVTGSVTNSGDIAADNIDIVFESGYSLLFWENIDLAPGETHNFTFDITSSDMPLDRSLLISGSLYGYSITNSTLSQFVEVQEPQLDVSVNCPYAAGFDPFDFNVKLANPTKVDADVLVAINGDLQEVTVFAGETNILRTQQSIIDDTTFNVEVTGDVSSSLSKTVILGRRAHLFVNAQNTYPTGIVNIPYTVASLGVFDGTFDISFTVDGVTMNKQVYVPAGESEARELKLSLLPGNHTLIYESIFGSGNVSFTVLKKNDLEMSIETDLNVTPRVISVNVANNGYNDFIGQIKIETDFLSTSTAANIPAGETVQVSFGFDPNRLSPGTHDVTATAESGGIPLKQARISFMINGAEFELTSVPSNPVFISGQEAEMKFKVRNSGDTTGTARVHLILLDIVDLKKSVDVAPGEEQEVSFYIMIPDDEFSGDYKADVSLNDDEEIEVPFSVDGISISAEVSLDKNIYSIDDTATMTFDITNQCAIHPYIYVRAGSNAYETKTDTFTLENTHSIALEIPVKDLAADKISCGVYLATGKALYLNAIYIRAKEGPVTIYTNKGVYDSGEEVTAYINAEESGTLTVSAPGYSDTIDINGDSSFTFTIPFDMTSGTYSVDYQFGENSGSCRFDVNGFFAKVVEVELDHTTYDPTETVQGVFTIEVSKPFTGSLQGWVIDPSGNATDLFTVDHEFTTGLNRITALGKLNAIEAGTHKLTYSIFRDPENPALVSGSESFDVRDAAIVLLATDKVVYDRNETVNVLANLFAYEETDCIIKWVLDGEIYKVETDTISGSASKYLSVSDLSLGAHTVAAILLVDFEEVSEKETEFYLIDENAPSRPQRLTKSQKGTTVILSWDANSEGDLAGYNVYCNGEIVNPVPITETSLELEDLVGDTEYAYAVTAIDSEGNESAHSEVIAVALDGSAPMSSVIFDGLVGSNGWYKSNIKVLLSALDNVGGTGVDKIEYKLNSLNESDEAVDWSIYDQDNPPVISSSAKISYRAIDEAGNVEQEKQVEKEVMIDTMEPVISNVSPANETTTTVLKPAISADVTDTVSGIDSIKMLIDGNDVTNETSINNGTISYVPSNDLMAGIHTVRLEVQDRAGNIATKTWSFIIEASEPFAILTTIEILPESANVVAGQTQAFTAIGKDQYGNIMDIALGWSVSGDIGTIDESGVLTASKKVSSGYVIASYGGLTAKVPVNVIVADLERICVSPCLAILKAGQKQTFTATGKDKYGNTVSINPTWSSTAGTIDSSGNLVAKTTPGFYVVKAMVGNIKGQAYVIILPSFF